MLIWQILNFLILAGGLGYLAVKQGGPLLAARSKEITDGLAAGEKAKAEADARAAQVQAKLANLEKDIAGLRAEAKDEREREADRIRRSCRRPKHCRRCAPSQRKNPASSPNGAVRRTSTAR